MHRLKLIPVVLLWCAVTALAANVRQVAIIDLPGRPGFDDAIIARGMLVIAHPAANTVDIFDPFKRRVIGHVKDLSAPHGMAVSSDGRFVYIANQGASSIVVLDTDDWQVQRSVPTDGPADFLLPIPNSQIVVATIPDKQELAVIDLSKGETINTATVGGRPEYLTYDAGRNIVYATVQDRREVIAVNPQLQIMKRFAINGSMPTGIVYDGKADRLYVAVRYAVLALDANSGREIARRPVAGGIDQLWLDSGNATLFGAANGNVYLMGVGGGLGQPEEINVEVKGHTLAFDSARKMIYVPGGREGHSKLLILKQVGTPQDRTTEAMK